MNTRTTTKIVMLVCALFVSANVFFSCAGKEAEKQLAAMESEKIELQKQFDSIMTNYEKIKSENTLYGEQFVEKDSIISAQATQIKNLLAELSYAREGQQGNNAVVKPVTKASKLRQQVKELQETCDNYITELETLKAENEALKAENEQIKVAIEETKAENEKLVSEKQTLEQKIENAKRLVTSDLTATPMRKKCGGKGLKATKHSNKLEVVKIEGRILANDVVDPGAKTIYARITGPNNRVLCNGTAEEFSFDIDGSPLQYTAKQDIEFDGSARKIMINWSRNENVKVIKGTYRVTLYADGQEIGKTSFKLTK